MQIKI